MYHSSIWWIAWLYSTAVISKSDATYTTQSSRIQSQRITTPPHRSSRDTRHGRIRPTRMIRRRRRRRRQWSIPTFDMMHTRHIFIATIVAHARTWLIIWGQCHACRLVVWSTSKLFIGFFQFGLVGVYFFGGGAAGFESVGEEGWLVYVCMCVCVAGGGNETYFSNTMAGRIQSRLAMYSKGNSKGKERECLD